jgi:hypothetical protein
MTAGTVIDAAVETLRSELTDVRESSGCGSCDCFLDVVAQARGDLETVRGAAALAAAAQFDDWLAEAARRVRSCRHCEVCVPPGPYRRFRETLDAATGDAAASRVAGERDSGASDAGESGAGEPDAGGVPHR